MTGVATTCSVRGLWRTGGLLRCAACRYKASFRMPLRRRSATLPSRLSSRPPTARWSGTSAVQKRQSTQQLRTRRVKAETGGRLRRRLRITRGIPSSSTVVVAVVVHRRATLGSYQSTTYNSRHASELDTPDTQEGFLYLRSYMTASGTARKKFFFAGQLIAWGVRFRIS